MCSCFSPLNELFEFERTPPFPVRNRKCGGNRGVNKHGTGWLRHTARVCYLAWEISNRFITLQRESSQAKFPATRAAGCEPENQGWWCWKTTYPSRRLKTSLLFVRHSLKALTGMNSCHWWDWWSWETYQMTCLYTNKGLWAKSNPVRTIFGAIIKANVLPFTAYHSTGGNNRRTKVTGVTVNIPTCLQMNELKFKTSVSSSTARV